MNNKLYFTTSDRQSSPNLSGHLQSANRPRTPALPASRGMPEVRRFCLSVGLRRRIAASAATVVTFVNGCEESATCCPSFQHALADEVVAVDAMTASCRISVSCD